MPSRRVRSCRPAPRASSGRLTRRRKRSQPACRSAGGAAPTKSRTPSRSSSSPHASYITGRSADGRRRPMAESRYIRFSGARACARSVTWHGSPRSPKSTRIPPAAASSSAPARSGARAAAESFSRCILQDISGEMVAKVFQDVDAERDAVRRGRVRRRAGARAICSTSGSSSSSTRSGASFRRTTNAAFEREDCIPCSPRPVDEMWQELDGAARERQQPHAPRAASAIVVARNAERLRIWPAARQVHHAYRSGLLEHVLKIMEVVDLSRR